MARTACAVLGAILLGGSVLVSACTDSKNKSSQIGDAVASADGSALNGEGAAGGDDGGVQDSGGFSGSDAAGSGDAGEGNDGSDGGPGSAHALLELAVSEGALEPAFDPGIADYTVKVGLIVRSLTVTAVVDAEATVMVNGQAASSGEASSPIELDTGDNAVTVVVSRAGQPSVTYTLTVMRGYQEAYIKASNTEAWDWFGVPRHVALSGDTLAVAAAGYGSEASDLGEDSAATGIDGDQDDNNAPGSGAVYVFRRTGGVWHQEAYIKASNTEAGDTFGFSVALDGDTLAVGAPGEDSAATVVNGTQDDNAAQNSGAVYVFTRSGTVWSQQAYLKAGNAEAGDSFGWSLALDGDTLAVAAAGEEGGEDSAATGIDGDGTDNNAPGSGAVYVFTRSNGNWSPDAYFKASNTEAGDGFGYSIDLEGDTLAVAATGDGDGLGNEGEDSSATGINGDQGNNDAPDSGAVYVFRRSGGVWDQEAYIKASDTEAKGYFGGGVTLDGDTLAAAGHSGIYFFRREGSAWSQQGILSDLYPNVGGRWGSCFALDGDLLAAGVTGESSAATGIDGDPDDDSAPGSGAVYVLMRIDGVWKREAYIKASNTEAGDSFGCHIALSDGTLAVAAPQESSAATGIDGDQDDNGAESSGAVYLFR